MSKHRKMVLNETLKFWIIGAFFSTVSFLAVIHNSVGAGKVATPPSAPATPQAASFFDLSAQPIEGQNPVPLSQYSGKTVLVVNVASRCGYTPQYKGLQSLYEKYQGKGLVILGFPSNDFGGQEPGSNSEIKKFCSKNYGVSFPLFAKSPVSGPKKNPVYRYLVSAAEPLSAGGEVAWNFEKFLISKKGQVVGRFKSSVAPDDKDLIAAIEKQL